jgi:hypothetical protein
MASRILFGYLLVTAHSQLITVFNTQTRRLGCLPAYTVPAR